MPETNYTYRGLIVEYWDLLRGDTSKWSSRPYFLKLIQDSGQPALDVACGTGRFLIDYAQEEINIDGVDISPEMIDLSRANADRAGLNTEFVGAGHAAPRSATALSGYHRAIVIFSAPDQPR